jgi:hypothetical protein
MKYLTRAVKYFIYFSLMCAAIITALVLIGAVEGDINSIFQDGYGSIWKIAIFFALVASVYPKVGFITRTVNADKSWNEIREVVIGYMAERRYTLETESENTVTFRFDSATGRLSKMFEDRLTFCKTENGWSLEGLRKDVFRLSMGLEHRLNPQSAE